MAEIYEANRSICKYVHSTSRGHEAIQLATAFHLRPCDYVSPYYRDESIMLGLGFTPYELMLQLLAKKDDPFTGGREYYNHPNYRGNDKPTIIHQSSATGMQAIPTTGIAQGIRYLEKINDQKVIEEKPVVICSLGDASVTEGEVSEAFQFAALHKLPILFLVQDNDWGISVTAAEARTSNAYDFIEGFKGIQRTSINGANFIESYLTMQRVVEDIRTNRTPWLVHARVPLLGHHTSGVRKDFYRDEQELAHAATQDPGPLLRFALSKAGVSEQTLIELEKEAALSVQPG
ncbi:MAG: thiamine pyrophosphate-dependent dehydrogenase E1 component subunit alpha [Ferruginibacter sp.]